MRVPHSRILCMSAGSRENIGLAVRLKHDRPGLAHSRADHSGKFSVVVVRTNRSLTGSLP